MAAQLRWAGFWIRVLAFTLDAVSSAFAGYYVFGSVSFFFFVDMSDPWAAWSDEFLTVYHFAMTSGIWLLPVYSAAFHASKLKATPGKLATRIFVVDHYGRRLSILRAFGREAAKILSLASLLVGFVMAGFTREKTALHDLIADTRVLRLPRRAETQSPRAASDPGATVGAATSGRRPEISKVAYVFAGLGLLPILGRPFALGAIVWGLLTRRQGGKRVVLIATCCVLSVVALYAVLGSLALLLLKHPMILNSITEPQFTRMDLNRLDCHIELFHTEQGRYPRDLEELVTAHSDRDRILLIWDPYSTKDEDGKLQHMRYEPGVGPRGYTLFSVGPDGEAHTDDDMHPPENWSCPPFMPESKAVEK